MCGCVWGVDLDVILPDHPPEVRHRGAQRTLGGDVSAVLCRPLEGKSCITKGKTHVTWKGSPKMSVCLSKGFLILMLKNAHLDEAGVNVIRATVGDW